MFNIHTVKKSKQLYFIAGIVLLIGSAVIISINNELGTAQDEEIPVTTSNNVEITGTPLDKYSPEERRQHCGNSDAKSNTYIREFEIPTPCTQPLSIISDNEGNIWFAQTNTGNLAMFDPTSEVFTEYQNDMWDADRTSMIWGIYYTQDEEIWFTDEASDNLWKFSIKDKKYSKFDFPGKTENSFPQKIGFYKDRFLINDFTGSQVITVNHNDLDKGIVTYSSINVPEGFYTSQASVDNEGNIWFVMWKYQEDAILIKTNSETQEIEQFSLPDNLKAPNGISIGPLNQIWIADTASSSFFKFNPDDTTTIEYVTSDPPLWTYGNSTGLIKTPITRPYWNGFDDSGKMWFNQQTANRMAVFDPASESLIEYDIPSKNPEWADCGDIVDCGISQNMGFSFYRNQVWFSEWVENNIGVVNSSITIPVSLDIKQDEFQIKRGDSKEIFVTITPQTIQKTNIKLTSNTSSDSINVKTKSESIPISNKPIQIPVTISVGEDTFIGSYKILFSTQLPDISVSSYATIIVT